MAKLGKELKKQFSQAGKSIAQCFSINQADSSLMSSTKAAVSKSKEVDTLPANIRNSNQRLSQAQPDALLSRWPGYEAMLQAYAGGSGSLAAAAEQTADT